jgi:transcriptional regulator with XRE-family HTH domain
VPKRSREDCRNKAIGQRIRAARMRLGLRQVDVAARLGVAYQSMTKYEAGDNSLNATRLLDLAAVLQVTVGWLVGETAAETDRHPARFGRLEARMMAAFARIDADAVKVVTVRAVEALGAAPRARKPDAQSTPASQNGQSAGAWT